MASENCKTGGENVAASAFALINGRSGRWVLNGYILPSDMKQAILFLSVF